MSLKQIPEIQDLPVISFDNFYIPELESVIPRAYDTFDIPGFRVPRIPGILASLQHDAVGSSVPRTVKRTRGLTMGVLAKMLKDVILGLPNTWMG